MRFFAQIMPIGEIGAIG